MSDIELRMLGVGEPETFRCRIYDGGISDEQEARRRAFIHTLAGEGALDCPAYDKWTAALRERGWAEMTLEPNPNGPGRVGRWKLTELGRSECRALGVLP